MDADEDAPHASFVNAAFLSPDQQDRQQDQQQEASVVPPAQQAPGARQKLSLKERLRRRREAALQQTTAGQQSQRQPQDGGRPLTEEEQAELEDEFREELSYYVAQVYELVRPIVFTFALTVWFVRRVFSTIDVSQIQPIQVYAESSSDSGWDRFGGAVVNALVMVGAIVVITLLFVCLFYFRLTKILYAWLGLSVTTTLGGLGATVVFAMCQSYNFTLDWLTLSIFLWNFAAVGILSIMWSAPLYIQQGYLVVISALLATDFTFLPEWTSWVFLVAISIYDLLSVLCPGGPLKMLVELSQKRNEPIPALLYSAGMADNSGSLGTAKLVFSTSGRSTRLMDEDAYANDDYDDVDDDRAALNRPAGRADATGAALESVPLVEMGADGVARETVDEARAAQAQSEGAGEDDEPRGVQLGLGDFIFYSVLVARAALTNWTTLIACALATLTGLCLTLLLLAIYRRALPALPISIAFGMIFYFATSAVITPYMNVLAVRGIVV